MIGTRFTGWHMTAILVAFFGVVVAVNMTMATLAADTFGGTVVDNSYVASQRFNGWIAKGRAEARLGWRQTLSLTPDRHVRLQLAGADGQPMRDARVDAAAHHPLGRVPPIPLIFRQRAPGAYEASRSLPAGRWRIELTTRSRGHMRSIQQDIY